MKSQNSYTMSTIEVTIMLNESEQYSETAKIDIGLDFCSAVFEWHNSLIDESDNCGECSTTALNFTQAARGIYHVSSRSIM